ncbi:RNA polymerase sigma factor [Frondihabitans sucicola]|uniref:RNA polymerase sigma factor n=1 Tax=Frondihabitans sucicola TaxID=1268041 RepID=UPI0025734B2E|nr:RNA polymerase sigma factor [Frondihabitans sucicola]
MFSELYDRHAATIHRYAARRVGPQVAEDVMSETFLVAFERRGDFDITRDNAAPWLYGIATTLLKQHARQEARSWKGLLAESGAQVGHDETIASDSRLDARNEMKRLASSLKKMNPGDRDVLLLHAWADLGYEGIAQALDLPIGTVRSRLNRARKVLRTATDRGAALKLEGAKWTS